MPKLVSNTVQVHIAARMPDGTLTFLILQRSENEAIHPSVWQVVTGTVEDGETALLTALRELNEETGLSVEKMWTIPFITTFFVPAMDEIHFAPVFGILVDYKEEIDLSSEHQDYKWLDYESTLASLAIPTHRDATKVFYNDILNSIASDMFLLRIDE